MWPSNLPAAGQCLGQSSPGSALPHIQVPVEPWSQGSPHLCSSHYTHQLQRGGGGGGRRITTPWRQGGFNTKLLQFLVTISTSFHSFFSFGLTLPTSQSELNTKGPWSGYWKGRRHCIHLSHQRNHLTAIVPALEVQPGEKK